MLNSLVDRGDNQIPPQDEAKLVATALKAAFMDPYFYI